MEPLKTFTSTHRGPADRQRRHRPDHPRALSQGDDKNGLGEKLFSDWRYDARTARQGRLRAQPPEAQGARCSSPATTSAAARRASTRPGRSSTAASAPWSRTSFADIFRNNALKNGLLPDRRRAGTAPRLLARAGRRGDRLARGADVAPRRRHDRQVLGRPVCALLFAERRRRAGLPAVGGRRHREVRGRPAY